MSVEMDGRDVCGYLRGVCLVGVARVANGPLAPELVRDLLAQRWAVPIGRFSKSLSVYTGIDQAELLRAVEELCLADEEFLASENVNLQLSLLSGRPLPVFSFVRAAGIEPIALFRPLLDCARNLMHAAVRVRMQSGVEGSQDPFWSEGAAFLSLMAGGGSIGAALALGTIVNVASDVLFFNAERANAAAPELRGHIARVLGELGTLELSRLL